MGTYTEVFFRAEIDEEAALVLAALGDMEKKDWPDHKFFRCERFRRIATGSSYYFPGNNHAAVDYDDVANAFYASFRADLKNYDNEIEKFFDWVDPHVIGGRGDFIGYSMEEASSPSLWFKESALWPRN